MTEQPKELMNPLLKMKTNTGLSWKNLADKSGLSKAQLRRITTRDPSGIACLRLETHIILKETLAIDFEPFLKLAMYED